MNEERIKEVFSDEAFVKQLLEQDTPEQVQALLRDKDIELTIEEIQALQELVVKHLNGELNMEELSDDDLENISGGICGSVIVTAVGWTLIGIGAALGVGGALTGGAALTHHFTRSRW